ncbi:baeRF2 domain-containing protein [Streptomyces chattanoogensis]
MRLSFLEPLYKEAGPFASVYLDTSRDSAVKDPDAAIAVRWRHLRDDLLAEGADADSLAAVARTVGNDAMVPGTHGQALFTAHGKLVLEDELPLPPARDTAHFGTLPDTMPLIVQHAPGIPYVAVRVQYTGRHSTDAEATVRVDAEAGVWPEAKVAPQGRLHEEIPVAEWLHTAEQLGEHLDALARRNGSEVLVIAGDVWARGILARRLPKSLQGRILTAGGGPAPQAGRALLEDHLDRLFAGRITSHDRNLLDAFLAQRAHDGASAEGLSATVEALQRGQVRALFLNHRHTLQSPLYLWVGPEPRQLALAEGDLRSYGVETVHQERADVALTRALVGTAAELILVQEEQVKLREGVGVLLRYAYPAPPA